MKNILVISLFCINAFLAYSQVANDDCSTATDLGTLPLAWNEICPDGTNNWSYGTFDSTVNAIPSSPYYSMNGCYGYSSTTTTLADDVWYKFRNTVLGIQLHVLADDTTHINLYHGTACNSLLPSGCWTVTNDTSLLGFYSSNDTINEYNYIQLSGIAPGRKIHYALCLRSWGLSSYPQYGNILVGTNSINENIYFQNDLQIVPNPASNFVSIGNIKNEPYLRYELFDMFGKLLRRGKVEADEVISLNGIENGMYHLLLKNHLNISEYYKVIVIK